MHFLIQKHLANRSLRFSASYLPWRHATDTCEPPVEAALERTLPGSGEGMRLLLAAGRFVDKLDAGNEVNGLSTP